MTSTCDREASCELIGELLSRASTVKEYDWESSKSRFLAVVILPVLEDMVK